MSEQINSDITACLSVRRANSDFDRKGQLASVYSLQGTDCRDGNVLKAVKSVGTVAMHACRWRYVHMSYLRRAYVLP